MMKKVPTKSLAKSEPPWYFGNGGEDRDSNPRDSVTRLLDFQLGD